MVFEMRLGTMMAGSPERMELERRVIRVVEGVDEWRRTDDYLELLRDGKRVAELFRSK